MSPRILIYIDSGNQTTDLRMRHVYIDDWRTRLFFDSRAWRDVHFLWSMIVNEKLYWYENPERKLKLISVKSKKVH